jgi:hypothetical protein
MCLIYKWQLYIWKDKEAYRGHKAIRVCKKCGLKQEYNDPNDTTTSSTKWVDANTGMVWQNTDMEIPKEHDIYKMMLGKPTTTVIHKGIVEVTE